MFARGSNPAVDRPNQRKSLSYGTEEVLAGRADWIDPNDHSKGIVCRAFLYSAEYLKPAAPEQITQLSRRNSLPPLEVEGTVFDDPIQSTTAREDRYSLLIRAEAFARFCDLDSLTQAQA